MAVKAKKAPARKAVAPRPSAAMRQRALELAVSVSAVDYSISTGAGGTGPTLQPGIEQRRKRFEDTATIIAAAEQFLKFMAA